MTKRKAKAKQAAVSDEELAQAIRDRAAELNALVGQLSGRGVEVHLGVRTRYADDGGRRTEGRNMARPAPELICHLPSDICPLERSGAER